MGRIPRKLKKEQKKYLDSLTNITTYAKAVTTPTLTFNDLAKAMESIKDYLPQKKPTMNNFRVCARAMWGVKVQNHNYILQDCLA